MINKWFGVGRLTSDPQIKSTSSGTDVLEFSIAVNDRIKNSNGEWVDYPNYFECVLFGARANSLSKNIFKGSKVAIDGRLKYQSWEKDGQKRSKVVIVVNDLDFMTHQELGSNQATEPQKPIQESLYDEEVPF